MATVSTANEEQVKLKVMPALLGLTLLEALVGCLCFKLGQWPAYEIVGVDEEIFASDDCENKVKYTGMNH